MLLTYKKVTSNKKIGRLNVKNEKKICMQRLILKKTEEAI